MYAGVFDSPFQTPVVDFSSKVSSLFLSSSEMELEVSFNRPINLVDFFIDLAERALLNRMKSPLVFPLYFLSCLASSPSAQHVYSKSQNIKCKEKINL